MKSQVVDAFLAKFQLKPHEVKVLRGTKDGSLHPVRLHLFFLCEKQMPVVTVIFSFLLVLD